MAHNDLAVISGSGGGIIVHKLCKTGDARFGVDKPAFVIISGSLGVSGSVVIDVFGGALQVSGSSSFDTIIDGQVNSLSNHLISALSNVSSSTDAPGVGSIFVYDGVNWIASGSVNPSQHASTHIASGSDAINGDRLDITFVPTAGYVRDPTVTQASSSIELAAHLAGIASALSSAAAGGEVNTASNLGSGEGLFAQKTLFDLEFKSLTSGSNLVITSTSTEVDISLASQLSVIGITASFIGDLQGDVTGNVLGNVIGDLTGNVLGNVTGDLTGDVTGNVLGNLVGDVTGNVLGNVIGDLTGNVLGDLVGNVTGQVSDISNHTLGELSNVSSSADSPTSGDFFVYDGTNWRPTGSSATGEDNTASNLGSGEGLFGQKVGVDLQFKSLTSGSNLALSSSANEVNIALANQISVTGVTASFVGDLLGDVTGDVTGNVLGNVVGDLTGNVLGDLVGNVTGQVSDISNHSIGELSNVSSSADAATVGDVLVFDGTNYTTVPSSSVGEGNTASNLGAGEGWFAQKVGVDLEFKSATTGSNLILSSSSTEVNIALRPQISVTGVTASFLGNVTGQVSDISNHDTDDLSEGSSNLYFTLVRARTAITASDTPSLDLEWDDGTGILSGNVIVSPTGSVFISPSGLFVSGTFTTASNLGAGLGLFAQKVDSDLQFKSLQSGSNMVLSASATEVTISLADTISLTTVSASNFVGGNFVGTFTGSISGTLHSALGGLSADDHPNYFYTPGRAGGQSVIGGTAAADNLTMQGNTVNTGAGRILLNTPVEFAAYSATTALYGFNYAATESFTSGFVGGGLNFSGDITFSNSLFIYESFRGAPTITTAVAPGFAAYTVLQALPRFESGAGASMNPLAPLILNAGARVNHGFTGTRTVASFAAINFASTISTSAAGTLNITNFTGMTMAPKWSTVFGSTVNFGTIRGIRIQTPTVAPFGGSSAGTELMTAYYAVDVENLGTFGGTAEVAAVRSAITAGTNQYFLLNNGGGQSDFGGGNLLDCGFVQCAADNVGLSLGAGPADVIISWNGTALEFDPLLSGAPDLRFQPFAADYWRVQGSAASQGIQFDLETITFGSTAADPSTSNFFMQFAAPNLRSPTAAGEYSDVHWTAGGSIAIGALTMSNVQAFKINSPAVTLAGGSIDDLSNLFVEAMPSFGATRMQAVRVLGRTRLDGLMTHNSASLATITGSVASQDLPPNNGGRYILLVSADSTGSSGPHRISGFVNVQLGDSFYLINTGSIDFLLGHQDASSSAANRIISPTAADLTLGENEAAKLWYDGARWRIIETTGA